MRSLDHEPSAHNVSPALVLAFVYLWPFFAVWSLNARPWFDSNDRNQINRFNGILILSLLIALAIQALLPAALLDSEAYWIAITILPLACHWVWLDGARGEVFRRRYRQAPASVRTTVRVASGIIYGAMLIWFFSSAHR